MVSSFLESLNPELRDVIRLTGAPVSYKAGQSVFKYGDAGVAIYIIESGTVRVHDGDLVLNMLGDGDVFGELAALGGVERTASATAEEDLKVLRVESEALFNALQERPAALRGLVKMLCERGSGMAQRMTKRSWKLHAAQQELEIGRRIQAGFLPDGLPKVPGYETSGHFQAARDVAGDFYDAFYIPSIDRLALVIGDVCDKGVGAALFMTLFRSLIRATAQSRTFMTWAVESDPGNTRAPNDLDSGLLVDETLTNTVALTNNYVATTHGKTSMFASLFIGLLDPQSGAIDYINAGHEEAFIIGRNGIRQGLPPTGPVVGIFAGAKHDIEAAVLEPGETIFLYTDGVPEATSESGEQFSDQRLRSLLESWQGTADQLLQMIVNSVSEFAEGARQHDDITMLASRRDSV